MMKRIYFSILFLLIFFAAAAQKVISIKIDGSINPASAAFIKNSLDRASTDKAECIIIHLNTPGGLLKSTRGIVSDILESPVPVIVYVSPSGAHAGSAGVFITMAAHIAAMAPSTNIGAAHPVSLQGKLDSTLNEKSTNDAAAFIRSIAQKRNRNFEWAEDAVRKSVSITQTEALYKKVIDIVAYSEEDLLKQVDGRTVEIGNDSRQLKTAGAVVERVEMNFLERFLNLISDPNLAYILMMIGFYGIIFELYSPGSIFPGVIGAISIILAFYAMHTLPLNYAGVALILIAIILFILEVNIVSHGILGIGGVVALVLGSMMLIKPSSALEFVKISWSVIITVAVLTALFFLVLISLVVRGQRRKTETGIEGMAGKTGEVLELLQPTGLVRVHGEVWSAESVSGHIEPGNKIRVVSVNNLKLFVEKI